MCTQQSVNSLCVQSKQLILDVHIADI